MTTLLYRGQNYVQHKDPVDQKECVELTYRRKHYNTCSEHIKNTLDSPLTYRGQTYAK